MASFVDSTAMDVMLSVESDDADALYRILKANGRVVYVEVIGTKGFLVGYERNYGPSVVAKLGELEIWNDDSWITLLYEPEKQLCTKDPKPPHAVPKDQLDAAYPLYNITSLKHVERLKTRTSEVLLDQKTYIFKTARFPFELPWLAQEIQAYRALKGTSVAPKFIGYVFETTEDRVTGILLEKLEGRTPGSEDLEPCRVALDHLHRYLVHGDLVKYNIIMTSEGPKFLDFETSVVVEANDSFTKLKDDDRRSLEANLRNSSDLGRPYHLT